MPVVRGHTHNTDTVRIKDMFNMISSMSVTSFIAVGLSIPSPEDPTIPAYSSNDMVQLYTMKSGDLNKFYRYSPNTTLMLTLWVIAWTAIGYYVGVYFFNHVNFEKAYTVVGEFIKRDIKLLEKKDASGERSNDQEKYNDDSSYYEDTKALENKWKKLKAIER